MDWSNGKDLPAKDKSVGSQSSMFIICVATLEGFLRIGLHRNDEPLTPPSHNVSLT